ncbi:MAG TPA: S41 family peptidase [Candidatus Acidoferrum sp.]|nr:S41 family peptidase [Candidatus Acidoferrum sp.]
MSPAPSKLRRIPRALVLFLLLSVFAITALPQEKPDAPTTPQVPGAASEPAGKQRLTAEDRKEVFEKIWKEIHDHYYDPSYNGVDWDEVHQRYAPMVEATKRDQEFYTLMNQMTSELHDAHTRFNSPEQWKNFRRQQGVTVGFGVDDIDGKTVVTSVTPGSDAAHAGIEPGMVVLRVDDTAVALRVAEIEKKRLPSSSERATRWFIYNRVFAGPADTPVKVALQRADGSMFEVSVRRQVYSAAPEVTTHVLLSGNVYIRFDGFQHPIAKEFRQALQKFRDAPGLIVDLRRNGGGDLAVLLPIAGYFFGKKTLFAKDSTRTGKPLSSYVGLFKLPLQLYVGRAGEQIYSGPVVILVDAHSASSSEVFAAGMQDTLRAKVIGSQSCGCVLGIAKPRVMKGGGVLEMSEVLWFSPKGRKLEGTGIIPDKIVVPSVADLQRRRDPVLAEADKSLVKTAVLESKEAGSRDGKSEPR